MRQTDGVFTREERKAAVWALLMAGVVVALGIMIQTFSRPSLGPWSGSIEAMTVPGVLDARPVVDIEAVENLG